MQTLQSTQPIPYAWAPTRNRGLLAQCVDQPAAIVVVEEEVVTSEGSSPVRPLRGPYSPSQSSGEEDIDMLSHMHESGESMPHVEASMQEDEPLPRMPCTCQGCDVMPNSYENRCCQREPLNNTHLHDYARGKCLLECQAVQHVLSEINVQLSWLSDKRFFGHTGDSLRFDNMNNKNYRYHAYRNYINLMFGKLGRHNRRVIPACVVMKIRATWPDPDGNYKGFIGVDEFGQPIDMDEADGF